MATRDTGTDNDGSMFFATAFCIGGNGVAVPAGAGNGAGAGLADGAAAAGAAVGLLDSPSNAVLLSALLLLPDFGKLGLCLAALLS